MFVITVKNVSVIVPVLKEDKNESDFVKTGGAVQKWGVADNVVTLPGLPCTTPHQNRAWHELG